MVLTIYFCSLLALNRQNLAYKAHYRDSLAAQQMARAGANYIVYKLFYSSNFTSDVNYSDDNGKLGYQITFDPDSDIRSVNNLDGTTTADVTNYLGEDVPPKTADIVVQGSSREGEIVHRIHIILKRRFDFDRALGSAGKIVMQGDVTLGGIKSVLDDTPAQGGIHSNYQTADETESAVEWVPDPGSYFTVENNPIISAVAGAGENIISSNIKDECGEDATIKEGSPAIELPSIDVSEVVQKKTSCPKPDNATKQGDTYYLSSNCFNDERYVDGDLVINGDVNLFDGTLYVDGDLTINGGAMGYGSVYVTGDISINGGNVNLITNQKNSVAFFSGGNIDIRGIDAAGYLQSLADQHPDTIGETFSDLQGALNGLQSYLDTGIVQENDAYGQAFPGYFADSHGGDSNWTLGLFGEKVSAVYNARWGLVLDDDPTNYDYDDTRDWQLSIPEPDGTFSHGARGAYIPALVESIKSLSNYDSDQKAQRIVKGLEEMAYQFRNNAEGTGFHDHSLPWESQSFDHRMWYTHDSFSSWDFVTDSGNGNFPSEPIEDEKFVEMFKEYYENNNPMDLNWGGKSYIQGLMYAEGDVNIANNLNLVGSVITNGNVTLDNSSLIYCEEYMKVFGAVGPVTIVSYREFQ